MLQYQTIHLKCYMNTQTSRNKFKRYIINLAQAVKPQVFESLTKTLEKRSLCCTNMPSNQVQLSPQNFGIVDVRGQNAPDTTLEVTNSLLQRNHDELHVFFRDKNGHNHLVHNLLTRLALGATPFQLQTTFDDDLPTQRKMPDMDPRVVEKMADEKFFLERIGRCNEYANFLAFFQKAIEEKGWREVILKYVFSRSRIAEAILPLMYDGAYHPIIHLGLGVEFKQPSIVAEALAQAAAHESFGTDYFFLRSERLARDASSNGAGTEEKKSDKALVQIVDELRANDKITQAAQIDGFIGTMKMKHCILAEAGEELTSLVSQFRVTPDTLEQKTAEMISFCAFLAGASQRAGCPRKVDFFFMHCVTSSIFLSVLVRQEWIDTDSKVRLVEWKGRLDLAWYTVCGVPELNIEDVAAYQGSPSGDMSWDALYQVVNEQRDDGHVAKMVRALKNGEEASAPFENGKEAIAFPIKGDHWLKVARMAYDSTLGLDGPKKWVVMTGMDKAWAPFR